MHIKNKNKEQTIKTEQNMQRKTKTGKPRTRHTVRDIIIVDMSYRFFFHF